MKQFILILVSLLWLTGCGFGSDNEAIETLNDQVDDLNIVIEELEDDAVLLDEKVEQLSKALTDSQLALEAMENEKNEVIQDLEDSITALSEENQILDEMLVSLQDIPSASNSGPVVGASLISEAVAIATALSNDDMASVALYVDQEKGLRFSPYQYVFIDDDMVFEQADVANFFNLTSIYHWGYYDGSGEPMELTTADYYDQFVYNADFINAPSIKQNELLGSDSLMQYLEDIYPGASYVEFYFDGFNPVYEGLDWTSMILIMELRDGQWYLLGIMHGSWTI